LVKQLGKNVVEFAEKHLYETTIFSGEIRHLLFGVEAKENLERWLSLMDQDDFYVGDLLGISDEELCKIPFDFVRTILLMIADYLDFAFVKKNERGVFYENPGCSFAKQLARHQVSTNNIALFEFGEKDVNDKANERIEKVLTFFRNDKRDREEQDN
jgi:hypothetical protein